MDDDQTNKTNTSDPSDQTASNNNNGDNTNADLVDPDDIKHQQSKPPSVTGEESPSGDMAGGEPMDIDEALGDVGLTGDDPNATPNPLGAGQEIEQDEKAS